MLTISDRHANHHIIITAVSRQNHIKCSEQNCIDCHALALCKGFYGLALAWADDEGQRRENYHFLRRLAERPADDLRAGFDGLLGGMLVAADAESLTWIERRILADAESADGDVRHAVAALRFYYTVAPQPMRPALRAALRHLLARAEFAAGAITDLARWQDWEIVDRVAPLYDGDGYPQPATRHAVVAYLSVCPRPAAGTKLERLRLADPVGVDQAEAYLRLTTGRE